MAQGLTRAEAAARLAGEGPNELPRVGRRRLPRIVRDVLTEPMFSLLIGAGLIYLLLGDRLEASLLLAFACLSVAIAVIQETRSEHVLEALRDLTSPRALVIRDGERCRIAGREVVRGDIVVLSEGDRVPADAILLEARELQIDESLLTGESVPVRKQAGAVAGPAEVPRPGGDDLPHVFSGTLIVRGQGLAEVRATGANSEIGRIGHSLGQIETASPRLTRQTRRIVRIAATGGLVCCLLVIVLYGLLRGGWVDALLAGIALGMSMLPEEFPLVLMVFMVMGGVADVAGAGPDSAGGRDRDLGGSHRPVHRQDRHVDREPHVGGQPAQPWRNGADRGWRRIGPSVPAHRGDRCASQCAGCLRSDGCCVPCPGTPRRRGFDRLDADPQLWPAAGPAGGDAGVDAGCRTGRCWSRPRGRPRRSPRCAGSTPPRVPS